MSDDSNKKGNGESAPAAGELLARARRAREISLADMAKELHLDEPKVRALEQNQFEALGAPVFAKGYLRKYAELVGVSEDDVIADYYRLNRSAGAPPLITRRPPQVRDFSAGPWIAGLAALLVVVLAAAWWFSSGADWLAGRGGTEIEPPVTAGEPAGREPANESGTENDEAEAADAAVTPVPDPSAPASTEPDGSTPAAAPVEPATRPAPEPVADGALRLRLAFSGDCWTEVTDRDGQRLYFGLGTSGDEVTVAGSPPLNVLLGDSENVSVFVNETAYPIPASARRGETARLTLVPR